MQLDEKYDYSKEAILNGEPVEFDKVVNNKKEKRPTYLAEIIDGFVAAAISDLKDAYQNVADLEQEKADLQEQLNNQQISLNNATGQASIKQDDDAKLKRAENAIADLGKTFDDLTASHKNDAVKIKQLEEQLKTAENNTQVADLQQQLAELRAQEVTRQGEYDSLAADVNSVLDGLEKKFSDLPAEA